MGCSARPRISSASAGTARWIDLEGRCSEPRPSRRRRGLVALPEPDRDPLSAIRDEVALSPNDLSFYSYLPPDHRNRRHLPLLVTVHGISRNALEMIEVFTPWAATKGFALLAPRFEPELFSDYQRLGRVGRGQRADIALEKAVSRFESSTGVEFRWRCFFGFSGGGQFVHRFSMLHPEHVSAAAVASAGWYTMPDPTRRYPYGLRVAGQLPGIQVDPARFLSIPVLTLVGDLDIERDTAFRATPGLDREQGRTRRERAREWTRRMRRCAQRLGRPSSHDLVELHGAGHDFRVCVEAGLVDQVSDFIERCNGADRTGFDSSKRERMPRSGERT